MAWLNMAPFTQLPIPQVSAEDTDQYTRTTRATPQTRIELQQGMAFNLGRLPRGWPKLAMIDQGPAPTLPKLQEDQRANSLSTILADAILL